MINLSISLYLQVFLQIMAFMMDNASNNNTLVDSIVQHANCQGISINNDWVCLHCMPHMIHLVALKVSKRSNI